MNKKRGVASFFYLCGIRTECLHILDVRFYFEGGGEEVVLGDGDAVGGGGVKASVEVEDVGADGAALLEGG